MISDLLVEAEHKMEMAVEHVAGEFGTVRTGRANPQLLQRIAVDYYGSQTPLQQLASISVPEPRLLVVQPFDKSTVSDIERAIQAFDEARSIWPEYHNVAEIGRALRKREDKLRDPNGPGWQQLYREIITRYSWGLPEDLRKAIRQGATQAY